MLKTCKESSLLSKKTQTSFISFNETVCKCQCTCKNAITQLNSSNVSKDQFNQIDIKPKVKVEKESKDKLCIDKIEIHNSFDMPLENESTAHIPESNNFEKPAPDIQDNDDVMLQLEMLFNGDQNDDDDLFDSILCSNNVEEETNDTNKRVNNSDINIHNMVPLNDFSDKKSLEDRLASMECSGILPIPDEKVIEEQPKERKHVTKKWICEIYFRKLRLFEKLDEIRDSNRKKYKRVSVDTLCCIPFYTIIYFV